MQKLGSLVVQSQPILRLLHFDCTARHLVCGLMLGFTAVLWLSDCGLAQTAEPLQISNQPWALPIAQASDVGPRLILIVGASGTDEYGAAFEGQASQWRTLSKQRNMELVQINEASATGELPRDLLRAALVKAANDKASQLWLVMLGHGTSERGIHKFNLVGPDVSSKELNDWLRSFEHQAVVINCSSASAPFLPDLSGPNRIVITATRSGSENNYSRFGGELAACILQLETDIDHDDEVSLLEAFLAAATKTETVYREQSRLATEHALLDDNGDKLGTGSEFFRGTRAVKAAQAGKQPDGAVAAKVILSVSPSAAQLSAEGEMRRAEFEAQIEQLRSRKPSPPTEEYWNELERLFLSLANVYSECQAAADGQQQ